MLILNKNLFYLLKRGLFKVLYIYETPWEDIPDVVKLDNCSITLVENEK